MGLCWPVLKIRLGAVAVGIKRVGGGISEGGLKEGHGIVLCSLAAYVLPLVWTGSAWLAGPVHFIDLLYTSQKTWNTLLQI